MHAVTRIALAAGLIGAAAIGSTAVVNAQYYYPPPGYGPPPPYGYGNGWRTWNGCPPGYTVQGRRRVAHLERLSAPLHDPGWRVQAVSRLLEIWRYIDAQAGKATV